MQITSSNVERRYELHQALVLALTSQTTWDLHSVGQRMRGLTTRCLRDNPLTLSFKRSCQASRLAPGPTRRWTGGACAPIAPAFGLSHGTARPNRPPQPRGYDPCADPQLDGMHAKAAIRNQPRHHQ